MDRSTALRLLAEISAGADGGAARVIRAIAASRPKDHRLYLVAKQSLQFVGSDKSIPGHVFIGGKRPDGTLEAHGFYPAEAISPDTLVENDSPGGGRIDPYGEDDKTLYRALRGGPGLRYVEFKVTAETYKKAMSFIASYADFNDYGLFTNSCVHAAFRTLNHAGVLRSARYPDRALPESIYDLIPAYKQTIGQT